MAFHISIWPNYVLSWGVHRVNLSLTQGVILARLYSGPATTDELTDSLYGEREDGGPLWSDYCIRVAITHLRRKLRKSPIGIPRAARGRYRIVERSVENAGTMLDRIADEVLDN